jgi:hypothetical protein
MNMDVNIKLLPFDFRLYREIPVKLRIGFFDNLEFMPTTPGNKSNPTQPQDEQSIWLLGSSKLWAIRL